MNPLIQSLKKPEKDICIYILLDPDTNKLMYVGQTIQGFKRIQEHYYKCNKRNPTGLLSKSKLWISNLKKQGKIFKVDYLEYFDTISPEIDETEEYWINFFRSSGVELLNDLTGGSFNRTYSVSQLDKKIISERTKQGMNNPITKEKCRQNLAKNQHTFNHKKSDECKKKISEAQECKVIYIKDDLGNIYRGLKEAAKALNVTFGTVWKGLNGYCKTVNGRTLTKISKEAK